MKWLSLANVFYKHCMNTKFLTLLALTFSAISLSAQNQPAKPISLFDGKTLKGWKTVNPEFMKLWSVMDGVITGGDGKTKIPKNTFLVTESEYKDFEFSCLFRISGDHGTGLINSGIQYRSKVMDGKMIGYQADIGKGYWGDIYDEHRRNKALVKGDLSTVKHLLKEDGWNSYLIRCTGNRHELYINGIKTSDYIENDPGFSIAGVIALQLHSGGVAKVEFRDIMITEL